jgi:5-methylcytosine-specific restriction endonuclease McrA
MRTLSYEMPGSRAFAPIRWCYAARAVERVLVLNASYEPLNVCSLRRAHVLVWKGRAEIVESNERPLRSACASFPRPHVIRLVTYVRVPRAVTRRISRRVLFARDGWQCAYCGSGSNRLTLDHVIPRSRGGRSVWENVVASCAPCNHRKGDRLLEETSMSLRTVPRPPTPVLFIRLTAEHIPDVWRQYLPGLEAAAA